MLLIRSAGINSWAAKVPTARCLGREGAVVVSIREGFQPKRHSIGGRMTESDRPPTTRHEVQLLKKRISDLEQKVEQLEQQINQNRQAQQKSMRDLTQT